LNGIDVDFWNPATDTRIVADYSQASMEGKKRCKAELQKKCGFAVRPEVPVLAIISRLAHQKGLDLLAEAAPKLLSRALQLIVLGDGDPAYRKKFEALGNKYPANAKVFLGFFASEAHSIYAGADMFLMPSLFEPCGLGQLINMRYGTVPIARATGGLKDTVCDADTYAENGNGFVFAKAAAQEFLTAADRALAAYAQPARWEKITASAMRADFSWNESAKKYEALYREAFL